MSKPIHVCCQYTNYVTTASLLW